MRRRHDSAPISGALARRWAQGTAQDLARWGHGHLAVAVEGGVCIAGLANSRGCCWAPLPIEAAQGRVVLQRALHAGGGETRCVNCSQALELTRWAHWTGPAAGVVAAEIAFARPQRLDPMKPWPAQGTPREQRKHWLVASGDEVRGRTIPPMFGHRRASLRWASAGLPAPHAAVVAAETGRGLAQEQLHRSAAERAHQALDAVPRTGESPHEQWLRTTQARLRICTDDTAGRTLWEPELVLEPDPGHITAVFLSPVDSHGAPIAPAGTPADELTVAQRGRRYGDETRWNGDVCAFSVATASDADPAALLRACATPEAVKAVRNRRISLEEAWQRTIGAPSRTLLPDWATAPTVAARLTEPHPQLGPAQLDLDPPTVADDDSGIEL